MTWDYRILNHGTHFALHEVYYSRIGKPINWTTNAIAFEGDTPEEVLTGMRTALAGAAAKPTLRIIANSEELVEDVVTTKRATAKPKAASKKAKD